MIKEFVDAYMRRKKELKKIFKEKHPSNYLEIVTCVIKMLESECGSISSERIHEIDDGDYQGTLLYVIAEDCCQPSEYWYVSISYGSCSGCDTLEYIRQYSTEKPTDEQINEYMTLCLHIVQKIKKM